MDQDPVSSPRIIQLRRNSLRLRDFDYRSVGAYMVTIVTRDRRPFLGRISPEGENVATTKTGMLVANVWTELPRRFPGVALDAFVAMPDHVHGILFLNSERSISSQSSRSLSYLIGVFKSFSAREINRAKGRSGGSVWQRGFHDRIIRNEAGLNAAREYVLANPLRWWLKRGGYAKVLERPVE